MKNLLAVAALAAGLAVIVMVPAAAIDVQPGGRGGAAVTVGEATTDDGDVVLDRCECDGGPLEAMEVYTQGGGTRTVRLERVTGTVIRTRDFVTVGMIIDVSNLTRDNAIVLVVRVDDGVLGTVERIAVRRTGFYWTDGGMIIDTTIGDLQSSVQSVGGAGA